MKKTGVIVIQPWLTKSVSKDQNLELSGVEYQAAVSQGFLDEEGSEKAAKTAKGSKKPGKKASPAEETK